MSRIGVHVGLDFEEISDPKMDPRHRKDMDYYLINTSGTSDVSYYHPRHGDYVLSDEFNASVATTEAKRKEVGSPTGRGMNTGQLSGQLSSQLPSQLSSQLSSEREEMSFFSVESAIASIHRP